MAFLPFRDRASIVLFRWPAVAAGLFVALGIHIVLTAFGLAMASIRNPAADGGAGAAVGLLIWSGLAWIAASFIGGYVTAWVADASRYSESLFHGLVLWGVLTVVLMFLPPGAMGGIAAGSEPFLSPAMMSSVAWFIAVGGLLSLGTTIWGAIIGSRVVSEVETKATDSYRVA